MLDRIGRVRLLYIVLGMLLVVGVIPLSLAGWLLSDRSAAELGSVERRYQAQLVQDKARQIELYGQRYRDVVTGLAQAFELAGGVRALSEAGSDARLQKALQSDPNLIALLIKPVQGKPYWAFRTGLIKREEVDERVDEVLALMSEGGLVLSRPKIIRSGQEM